MTFFSVRQSITFLLAASLTIAAVFLVGEIVWTSLMFVKPQTSYATPASQQVACNHGNECLDRLASQFQRVEDIFCLVLPKFIEELKNPCFFDYGYNNSMLQCLPYFFIIGMDKSGSTDLHSRLVKHPFVMGNKGYLGKETAYWSWLRYGIYNKRTLLSKVYLQEYIDMFSDTARLIESTNMTFMITGDATPMDLWDFRSWPLIPQNFGLPEPSVLTPHLLRHLYGQHTPKFIIQFREPLERLYSDYIFLDYGHNTTDFHKHVVEAIHMIRSCLTNYSRRVCYFSNELYQVLPARIHLGCYPVFLNEWLQVFPRSSFLITTTDEYTNNMQDTLLKVFSFLDLPALPATKMAEILKQKRRNVTKKKEGEILPETVRLLRDFYDSCNREMAELLGDDRFLWKDHYT